jgi:uncharacterized protein YbbC (DUF1343 family)
LKSATNNCLLLLALLSISFSGLSKGLYDTSVRPAAYYANEYLPLLKGKRVALVINQTSTVGKESVLDQMLYWKINIKTIFVPEHGFRGNEDAGAHIANTVDSATGIPVISLYGNNKKPRQEQLADIDVVVYDLQDVGVRFYTYINTMQYCMEACAEAGKEFIVLDRPNPNGFYVDGPVLEKEHASFVGLQAIPIVYGMTAGEYAKMLVGEAWFANAGKLDLKVVKCHNYTHSSRYKLPVPPSPNLRTMEAVYAYPSLCLFEGTVISMGRGTDKPFRLYGCPEFEGKFTFSFTPHSGTGAKKPPYEDKPCYGELVAGTENEILSETANKLQLKWLMRAYDSYPDKRKFFTSFFTNLCGNTKLKEQIVDGEKENIIRKTWAKDLNTFRKIRKKYLLYPDFI